MYMWTYFFPQKSSVFRPRKGRIEFHSGVQFLKNTKRNFSMFRSFLPDAAVSIANKSRRWIFEWKIECFVIYGNFLTLKILRWKRITLQYRILLQVLHVSRFIFQYQKTPKRKQWDITLINALDSLSMAAWICSTSSTQTSVKSNASCHTT